METATQRWARIVEEFEGCGLGTKAFAEQRRLNEATLKWWRSRLRHRRSDPKETLAFVEVVVPEPVTVVRVRLDRVGAAIDVPVGTDLGWLRTVVDALC